MIDMKLSSLYIDKYKNIQHGVLFFSEEGYTALVGENGSGKSNWVEAVTAVCCHLIEGQVPPFHYTLKLDGNKQVSYDGSNIVYKDGDREINREDVSLPKRLIVCYSGEDHRLWEAFLQKSYAKYFGNSQMNSVDEPTILYVNRYHWAVALITLLCSEQDDVKGFLRKVLNINEIELDKIKVVIEIDEAAKGYKDENAVQLLDTLKTPDLYMRAIQSTNLGILGDDNLTKCKRLYYLLYALSMPVENKALEIKMRKAVKSINIVTDGGLSLSDLSEGHKKRILMMLMTRILGDDNTVYLYDEPDAHVDVTAKKGILDLIATAKGYTLMTTHSPIMTSMMKPEAVETVTDGFANKQKWADIMGSLSDNRITSIDSFLFTFKKKVFITEGKSDILYILKAMERLKDTEPWVMKLKDAASFCLNGAGGVDFFLENSLLPIVGYYDKMLFLFDNDKAGKEAQKKLDDFLNSHKELKTKISSRVYANIYTRPINHDFLVEDYFPATCYQGKDENIPNFTISGFPKYNEIKKMSAAETAIKNYIAVHYKDADFDARVYAGFKPLLEEIIKVLEL